MPVQPAKRRRAIRGFTRRDRSLYEGAAPTSLLSSFQLM
jgi:hypothetical protein